ncbi:MAG: alpha-1,2-fucosyltransferase [Planctomycetes bacterium]|jgi:hypothetical protein|nr:alpha-1,2-fucosyltransferase [Planctomycetota bacterium]
MFIINLNNGLGNQMFQYALGRSLSEATGQKFYLDLTYYRWPNFRETPRCYELNKFNIKENILSRPLSEYWHVRRLLQKFFPCSKYFKEKSFDFFPEVLALKSNKYLEGYWQSPHYFEKYREIIVKDFTLKKISSLAQKWQQIILNTKNAVAVHVRRGDYVKNAKIAAIHGSCDLTYYHNCQQDLLSKVENPVFFCFSDDREFLEKNFIWLGKINLVSHPDLDAAEEIFLMSLCQHQIISNSTFSWWAAWLNSYPQKIVYAPKQWFKKDVSTFDLLPVEWLRF